MHPIYTLYIHIHTFHRLSFDHPPHNYLSRWYSHHMKPKFTFLLSLNFYKICLYKFNIWTTFQRSSQGKDHCVERPKEAIWLLPKGPYWAVIGKVVVAQEKEFFLKKILAEIGLWMSWWVANNQESSR
jgi:hypothetical protein